MNGLRLWLCRLLCPKGYVLSRGDQMFTTLTGNTFVWTNSTSTDLQSSWWKECC